jgi:hypothetical protein
VIGRRLRKYRRGDRQQVELPPDHGFNGVSIDVLANTAKKRSATYGKFSQGLSFRNTESGLTGALNGRAINSHPGLTDTKTAKPSPAARRPGDAA